MSSSTEQQNPSAAEPVSFSFSTANFRTTFSDLLNGIGSGEDGRNAGGVPKFKSRIPPSLPIINNSQSRGDDQQQQQQDQPFSPSCFFQIPPGLSPAELLDSPVLLAPSSHVLSSPTTGALPTQQRNSWMSNNFIGKDESRLLPEFSFHANPAPVEFSDPKKSILTANQMVQAREPRTSEDGYNWRKYGQKHVKGSDNPRSYYKCTFQNCPTKKKVEKSLNGEITEIVYKGTHNHPKPQSRRRNSSQNNIPQPIQSETSDHYSSGGHSHDAIGTPDNSSISIGDEIELVSQIQTIQTTASQPAEDEEPEAKRWKKEGPLISGPPGGNKTVKEPRVVVQTRSDIDILDDGYRWRKYGQKVVKGNPNPRSYYKCTTAGCPVRKHVERASQDTRSVITTYEGKHDHDVPVGRGPGLSRPTNNKTSTNNMSCSSSSDNVNYDFAYNNQMRNTITKDEPRDDLFIESLLY